MDSELAQVRRFNRTVTQRVGALSDRYLSHDRPLGEARMLWEIGPEGCEVKALRARLDLDSGHASRLLRALEADGMITVAPSAADGRVRAARLTAAGAAERASLDARSDALARSFLEPLTPGQRERLVGAMHDVERLLTAALVEIAPADAAHPDARFCLRLVLRRARPPRRARLRPGEGHLRRAARAAPARRRAPARLAARGADRVRRGETARRRPAEIKRMWIAPAARGLGLGRRLLTALEAWAIDHGAPRAAHGDQSRPDEAISLYRSTGYAEVPAFNAEPFADVWLEKRL